MKLFLKNLTLSLALSLFSIQTALAESDSAKRLKNIASGANYPNITGGPKTIVLNIVLYALGFVGIFFVGLIIWSGFEWIKAGGNEDIIDKAKMQIKNALIGLFVIISSYAITYWVFNIIIAS